MNWTQLYVEIELWNKHKSRGNEYNKVKVYCVYYTNIISVL